MATGLTWLLNRDRADQVVDAPAFSLTKVLGTGAVIVSPLATLLVAELADADFKAPHIVALVLGLLGFLAIAAAADVLARSIATAAEKNAEAAKAQATSAEAQAKSAEAAIAQLLTFEKPLRGRRLVTGDRGEDVDIEVLAAAGGTRPFFLVKEGEALTWLPRDKVVIH